MEMLGHPRWGINLGWFVSTRGGPDLYLVPFCCGGHGGLLCIAHGTVICGAHAISVRLTVSNISETIARVRRAMPRNADVMEVCDFANDKMAVVMTSVEQKVMKDPATSREAVLCSRCEKRRAAHAVEMRKYRANRRSK